MNDTMPDVLSAVPATWLINISCHYQYYYTPPPPQVQNCTDIIITTYTQTAPENGAPGFSHLGQPPVPFLHLRCTPATPGGFLMPGELCSSHSFLCRSRPFFLEYPSLIPLVGPTLSLWAECRPQPSAKPSLPAHTEGAASPMSSRWSCAIP